MIEKKFTSREYVCSIAGITNIFANLPCLVAEERFDTLLDAGSVRIERIVSTGQVTPADTWYDQNWDEWILVLSGSAVLMLEGNPEPHRLTAGDCLLLPAHQRHRVEWTAPDERTVWLAVHIGEQQQ
ncbi:cupin domain-containing protein [Pelotalea chapellei]|uniref:Cupin domain-containing protein n=1 Tax=Pelotalea chapellei TaxID=44671 RepID=A0ABS5U3D8_9BACT|nr:cupin domain-containing protein [Pelotalea chapellei]MBT1070189.1 cupin domain-containing protein [Pelotalea chapellei]